MEEAGWTRHYSAGGGCRPGAALLVEGAGQVLHSQRRRAGHPTRQYGGGRPDTACQGSWGVRQGTLRCYVWSVFRGLWVPTLGPRAFVCGLGALGQGCSSQPPPGKTLWREACGEKHVAKQHAAASNSSARSIQTRPSPSFPLPSHPQNTHTQAPLTCSHSHPHSSPDHHHVLK